MTKLELAGMLERFIGDQPDHERWFLDTFTSTSAPAGLKPYQRRLREMDPPLDDSEVDEIRQMIKELRHGATA
jgi:hypothetical protein